MAHNGRDMPLETVQQIILPDLLGLTRACLEPLDDILSRAKSVVRALTEENGRISSSLIERNQTAAHGLAWLATYVEALRPVSYTHLTLPTIYSV